MDSNVYNLKSNKKYFAQLDFDFDILTDSFS